jgi:acyl-CoA dehydrogenase
VLTQEAGLAGGNTTSGDAAALARLARDHGGADDGRLRQDLARAWTAERLVDWAARRGGVPSAVKVLWSETRAHKDQTALSVLGPAGMLSGADAPRHSYWQTQFLDRFWGTIGGGTNEVHRTMIGERALGLPPERRVDKDVPFRDQVGPA